MEVLVAGGGNAGICAAIAAAEAGAHVLLLESLGPEVRGGNSKYTRNVRTASHAYPADEMLADLLKVTGDGINRDLARFTIEQSRDLPEWMARHGVRWQAPLRGTLQLGRTNHFFLGGGKALLNTYYRRAAALGIRVEYDVRVTEIVMERERLRGVWVDRRGTRSFVKTGALVAASGGYESNREWLRREWGEAADQFVIRGTAANDGLLLSRLFDLGARRMGNPRGFHAIAVDARSPRYDGGIATRVDSVSLGIVVNAEGKRFYDEGEDIWPKRYATWGKLIAEQPGQIAFSIFDSQAYGKFVPACYPPHRSETIEGIARELRLDHAVLRATVDEYNQHVMPGTFDRTRLDELATWGLTPPKSNWARPIDKPPYYAYAVRPGITFTFLGVGVDEGARVVDANGSALPGIFAAGEIMAGNVLSNGYLAGFGMTIGTVFGRIAGEGAAHYARQRSPD
ncbi:MAG: FAD-dependent tricarballylate dehydrogenase TcuA [bacterium]|nr:FAD-dependent tricarballylate dehydrogenase TcuA [bacterium]